MTKKELTRGIVFLLLAALIFQLLTTIFIPKWYGTWQSTRIVDGFYELPEDSLDVVLLGSSQTIMGLSPLELYEEYGISSYSFGTEEQPIYATYYWLKEILRFHTPQVVVVDVNEIIHSCNEAAYRKAFDYMEWSEVKWEAVRNHCESNEDLSMLSYLLPFTNYHSRWDQLSEDDFTYLSTDKTDPYFGFVISSGTCEIDYDGFTPKTNAIIEQPEEEAYEYIQKIVDLCGQENINLLFVKTPRAGWSQEKHDLMKWISKETDTPFLDFNEKSIMKEMAFDYSKNARDGSHLNIYGAEKVGSFLGTYLKEHYELQDRRGDSYYSLWSEMLSKYQMQSQEAKLVNSMTFENWLNQLQNHHTLLLSVSDGYLLQNLHEGIWNKLEDLGFNVSALKSGADYVSVVENGMILAEHAGLGISDFHGIMTDGAYFELSVTNPDQDQDENPSVCTISIDHIDYAVEGEGLHLAVYDPIDREVVDSILVNTQTSEYPLIK